MAKITFKTYENVEDQINDLFLNDTKIAKMINKMETREKLLAIGLIVSLGSLYKLNRKCKAQRIRMEVLEHRMNCFVDNQLDIGKETNESNA